jgi:RNA polymerase sigma-70 factor (sigma-E family)
MTEAPQAPTKGWDEYAPLYDEHHERLYRVALLLCHGQAASAEDAVAETFVRVYGVWSQPDTEIENFFAYARRALVSQVIAQQRRRQVADAYVARHGAPDTGDPDPGEQVATSAAAFDLLGRLPPRQRSAVVLRYYEDLPYEQIAEAMDVSVGTVKAQVSMGLRRMRELWRETEVSGG